MLLHHECKCGTCERIQGSCPTVGQCWLLFFLTCLLIIPGVIYYFAANGKRCWHCGCYLNNKYEYRNNLNKKKTESIEHAMYSEAN